MPWPFVTWQIAMLEVDPGTGALGDEPHVQRAGPGWQALSAGDEGMLLYDMDVTGLGTLRVAEHFTVEDGQITRIRQIHDTAALRTAGFVG